jgi:hypothetical protein
MTERRRAWHGRSRDGVRVGPSRKRQNHRNTPHPGVRTSLLILGAAYGWVLAVIAVVIVLIVLAVRG